MNNKPAMTAIKPTRNENYPEWYQQVIKAADLAEPSVVRGCMVIKPWGYAIWERIQATLDRMFKETGHVNAYFPLFIPMSFLAKEAEHVEGFAKECAVVTHHRLMASPTGKGLVPASPLEEPLVIRPTSETIIGETYSKWVQSYRDLPILINQWANIVRWEMRTRLFLRTTEFLWQEGHTAHATSEEAVEETVRMLDVYENFAHNYMAMPVIKGEKPRWERFPGAINTYSIEAMMQDRKALQSGTSHFLGQNFSHAHGIKFLNKNEKEEYAWTTSWGVSTRLIGGIIMTHSDDDGLVLPPKLAPKHVVIIPIYKNDAEKAQVLEYCQKLVSGIEEKTYDGQKIAVQMDSRDVTGSERSWQAIKRGIPVRAEVGMRDMASNSVFMGRRDKGPKEKEAVQKEKFVEEMPKILSDIQSNLMARALKFREESTRQIDSFDELKEFFDEKTGRGGFAHVYAADDPTIMEKLDPLKITARGIPLEGEDGPGKCIFTGKPVNKRIIFAQAY